MWKRDCLRHGGCALHPLGVPVQASAGAWSSAQPNATSGNLETRLLRSLSPDLVRYLNNMAKEEPTPSLSSPEPSPSDVVESLATTLFTPATASPLSAAPSHAPSSQRALGDVAKRPRMTTQMNPTWMADYTSDARAMGSSSQRPKQDLLAIRKFFLVFWDNDSDPATVRLVQECPNWPSWKFIDYTELPSLTDKTATVQLYSSVHRIWVNIELNHTHSLTTNCAVLMRRKGVLCVDEQAQLDRFIEPKSVRQFRQGMADERAALRRLEKGKFKVSPRSVDIDSDIEVTDGPIASKRRRIAVEPDGSPLPRLVISSDFIDISDSPAPTPATRPSSFPDLLPLSSPVCTPSRSQPSSRWPARLSTAEMVRGFEKIDRLMQKGVHPGQKFKRWAALMDCVGVAFGRYDIPYSTYHDQWLKWEKASQELRDEVLGGNDSMSRLWSYLSSQVPLK